MFKLINDNGTIHNFSFPMYWGHNIEGSDTPTMYEYDDLTTQQYSWDVFNEMSIHAGDFITRRNSDHTKVLLYEVILAGKKKFSGTSFGPNDCYEVTVRQCGYYKPGVRTIFNGYGIEKPTPVEVVKSSVKDFFKRLFWK